MRFFQLPNTSRLTKTGLLTLYARVRSLLLKERGGNLIAAQKAVIDAFRRFLTRLGQPLFQHKEIHSDDPLDPDEWNESLSDISADMRIAYEEVDALRDASIAVHNYAEVRAGELKRRTDVVSGLVTDLRLLSGQIPGELLIFGDNFADASKIDSSFPLDAPVAQIMPGQGALTLNRIGVVQVGPDEVDIQVTPLGPSWGTSRAPNRDNTQRFYEGHFYSFLGEAEPEGGSFHLKESLDKEALAGFTQEATTIPVPAGTDKAGNPSFTREQKRSYVVPGGFEARFLEQVQSGVFMDKTGAGLAKFIRRRRRVLHRKDRELRESALYLALRPEEGEPPSGDIPLTPENIFLVEAGASEEELQAARLKMMDGNPASYWQCEVVRRTDVLQNYIDSLLAQDDDAEIPPSVLRDLAASEIVDTGDLEVEVLITLSTTRSLNWITLAPMTFDAGAWIEVTDVSTAPDLESPLVPVESFVDRTAPNVLTEEANEEVTRETASQLLAPNRFSFRGTGVWPFSARPVTVVRLRLKQRVPVPNPYERIVLETTRTHTERPRRRRTS